MDKSDNTVQQRETIMIVDDERFNLNLLQELLATEYDLIAAMNGTQALQRVTATPPPDLILLDILMPGMDGYQVLQRLKGDPTTAEIPVIFITAMSADADESKGLQLGAVDYITKPFAPSVVLARVKTQLLLQRTLRREKALNQSLAHKNAELHELNQVKNQFIGMAAHDLRNPLSVLLGMSTLLLEAPPSLQESTRREFLVSMQSVSEQMLGLVNDLLDVSVIESGSFILNKRSGSLAILLTERVRLAQFAAQTKRTTIHYKDNLAALAQFDAGRLGQVMDNLLSNAIKFSPAGSQIWVELIDKPDHVGFAVTDEGPGITAKEQAQLFGSFQKLSNQPTGGEKSTGLGLAISKKIVVAHGGTIQVEPAAKGGSRFTVTLPR
ncbi:MAG: hybrid sensor histidine kinase/response regulator [Magnetococcales bacterium]|nr:hybrid sensor histidine kinase/response regulator [Magnetococcales bacterium]